MASGRTNRTVRWRARSTASTTCLSGQDPDLNHGTGPPVPCPHPPRCRPRPRRRCLGGFGARTGRRVAPAHCNPRDDRQRLIVPRRLRTLRGRPATVGFFPELTADGHFVSSGSTLPALAQRRAQPRHGSARDLRNLLTLRTRSIPGQPPAPLTRPPSARADTVPPVHHLDEPRPHLRLGQCTSARFRTRDLWLCHGHRPSPRAIGRQG